MSIEYALLSKFNGEVSWGYVLRDRRILKVSVSLFRKEGECPSRSLFLQVLLLLSSFSPRGRRRRKDGGRCGVGWPWCVESGESAGNVEAPRAAVRVMKASVPLCRNTGAGRRWLDKNFCRVREQLQRERLMMGTCCTWAGRSV